MSGGSRLKALRFAREKEDHSGDDEHRDHAGDTEYAHNRDRVAADRGAVVAAVENEQVDRIADLFVAGLEQRHAQIARRVVDPGKIFRHAAIRRNEHDDAGVGELVHLAVGAGNAHVVEAGGAGDRIDAGLAGG